MIYKFDQFLEKMTEFMLKFSLAALVFIASFQIILRWFDKSIPELDPLGRHLVLLSAFLGGSLACGEEKHIRIDLIPRLLKDVSLKSALLVEKNLAFFSAFLCFLCAYACLDFLLVEKKYVSKAFFDLPTWTLLLILPFGFSLMAIRFMNRGILKKGQNGND